MSTTDTTIDNYVEHEQQQQENQPNLEVQQQQQQVAGDLATTTMSAPEAAAAVEEQSTAAAAAQDNMVSSSEIAPAAADPSPPTAPLPEPSVELVETSPDVQPQQQQETSEQQQLQRGRASPTRVLDKTDAETYLNDVKRTFAAQPEVYHQFVELMKSFKSGLITTPNVIQNVAILFHGFQDLISGFYEFLPPMYKQNANGGEEDSTTAQQQQQYQQQLYAQQQQEQAAAAAAAQQYAYQQQLYAQQHAYHEQQQQYHQHQQMQQQYQQQLQQQQQAPPPQQQQQGLPQFDHAIHYVNRIKKRFQNDNETYKTFLDILHTYQREAKSVNEVLNQVSELFRDHPDLLKDFTYFLPDSVQAQAKDEIQRITARRKKAGRMHKQSMKSAAAAAAAAAAGAPDGLMPIMATSKPPRANESKKQRAAATAAAAAAAAAAGGEDEDDEPIKLSVDGSQLLLKSERRSLSKIKSTLTSNKEWEYCLYFFKLFTEGVLTRNDLMNLLAQFNCDGVDDLERLLASRGIAGDGGEYSVNDPYNACDRPLTTSYRLRKFQYDHDTTQQLSTCRSVLNSTAVIAPELVQNKNAATPTQVEEPIEVQVERRLQACLMTISALETNCTKLLSRTQVSVIQDVYGQSAAAVLELLRMSPEDAVPVVTGRLRGLVDELSEFKTSSKRARMDEQVGA